MNGEYFKPDSKCAEGSCGGIDRISELPDEIIISILSFLSLKEVVSTSILSSRWSDLWKSTPNLNFNTKLLNMKPSLRSWELESSWDVEKCKYMQMVNSVLKSHKALCLKEFKISLYVNKSAQSTVTEWLEFLFSRQVETLELDFLCRDERHMVALEDILRDSNTCRPQTVVFFKSLKRLCLKYFTVSGEAIDLFLRNCPLLKRLSVQYSCFTSDVVVCGTTLVLEHLDIGSCNWSGKNKYIKVSAPNLSWLRIDSTSEKLLLENLPNLIGADFTCRGQSVDDAKHFASAVFCCISRQKFLHLNILYPKVFLANDIPRMRNLKRLTMTYCGVYNHGLLPITALIWASPRLKEIKLKFVNLEQDPTHWREGLTNVTRHPHHHLKVFKFEGFCVDADDHIELVTYISNNCVALKKIMISCYPFYYRYDQTCSERIAKTKSDRVRAKQLLQENVPRYIKLIVSSRPYLL